jgi:hypothetical protein
MARRPGGGVRWGWPGAGGVGKFLKPKKIAV